MLHLEGKGRKEKLKLSWSDQIALNEGGELSAVKLQKHMKWKMGFPILALFLSLWIAFNSKDLWSLSFNSSFISSICLLLYSMYSLSPEILAERRISDLLQCWCYNLQEGLHWAPIVGSWVRRIEWGLVCRCSTEKEDGEDKDEFVLFAEEMKRYHMAEQLQFVGYTTYMS